MHTMFKLLRHSGEIYLFESRLTGQILNNAGTLSETFFSKKHWPEVYGKIKTRSAGKQMQPTFPNPSCG